MHLNEASSTSLSMDKKSQDSSTGEAESLNVSQHQHHQQSREKIGITSETSSGSCQHSEDQFDRENNYQTARSTNNDNVTNQTGQIDSLIAKSFTSSFNGPALSANDISIMQDSTDFQWFNEETYQRDSSSLCNEKMPIIDKSLLNSDSSSCDVNRYHALSRNIDATLAEIDMENFRSEDITNIYSTIPVLNSQCGPVAEDGGEEYASVSGSLLEEIHSDNHYLSSKRFGDHESDLNGSSSIFDSSLIGEEPSTMRSERIPGLISRHDISGVSVDSLDFESSENDTNEMILRCREQDKTKYTIAFEESISSMTTFSDSNDDTKNNSEESYTAKYDTSHLRRRGPDDDFVKSEYTTWNQIKRRPNNGTPTSRQEMIKLRRYPFRSAAKQSQSLPNIVQVASVLHGDEPLFPPLGSYIPLYDLNKSNTTTNSSNSEVSPPRSLIRLFIKNRVSPSSSSPGSSSNSFEGHFNESHDTNTGQNLMGHHGTKFSSNSGFQVNRDNLIQHRTVTNQGLTLPDDMFEDSLVSDENVNLINNTSSKAHFNRLKQTASPIREEDAFDSSRADEAIASETDESVVGTANTGNGTDLIKDKISQWPGNNGGYGKNERIGVARRSISVDRFMSTQATAAGPSVSGMSSNIRRSSDYGSTNMNKIRFSVGKEFGSVSSGYLSSRQGSSEWHRKIPATTTSQPSSAKKYSISVTTMKTASTQVPVHIQDKQVQTNLITKNDDEPDNLTRPSGFIVREYPTNTTRDKEVPIQYINTTASPKESLETTEKKPLYVCFPNYSLPDLSFLRTLSLPCTPSDEKPSTIYLSPTKLKVPSREVTPSVKRTIGRKGVRPKSCTDYENMIANRNFNHINDWDSLKVLLPNEFKSLIARLEGSDKASIFCDDTVTDQGNGKKECNKSNVQPNNSAANAVNNNVKETSSPLNEVKFRPRKMVNRIRSLDSQADRHCDCNARKRHSLQEPPSTDGYSGYPGDPCSCRISRSVTMPSCVCHIQQQQQPVCHANCCQSHHPPPCLHYPQPVHTHQPVNSCCQGRMSTTGNITSSASHTSGPSSNGLVFDDPSVDRLCHLLSKGISVKDFTNIIGTGNSSGGGGHHKSRLSSPSKPYAPIKEQIEENDSMYTPSETPAPQQQQQQNTSTVTSNRLENRQSEGTSGSSGTGDEEDGSNFNELKKRWESLATSPGTSLDLGLLSVKKPIKSSNVSSGSGDDMQTQPPSSASTSNTNSTANCSSKPKVPAKPPLSSLRPICDQSAAKRPTTLGSNGFKSMIPIAKGSKSPPLVAKATSPSKIPRNNGTNVKKT